MTFLLDEKLKSNYDVLYPDQIAEYLPLIKYISGGQTQETGILHELCKYLPAEQKWAVEFGQRTIAGGTLKEIVQTTNWSLLNLDANATDDYYAKVSPNGEGVWQLAKTFIKPETINKLFDKYGVPNRPTILVVDIDGMDFWCLQAILLKRRPELILVEYNCNIPANIEISLALDESHVYQSNKNYGASIAAFVSLAEKFGYKLIHIHGPLNLYFIRNDIVLPAQLLPNQNLINQNIVDKISNVEAFYDYFHNGRRPSWFGTPVPDFRRSPWVILNDKSAEKQIIEIDRIKLLVLKGDKGGDHYKQRGHKEDSVSPLWSLIRESLKPKILIDIGANYGFTASLLARELEVQRVALVEPDSRLLPILQTNINTNIPDIPTKIIHACCGDFSLEQVVTSMALNPQSSQDNRVNPEGGWSKILVPTLRLDQLLNEIHQDDAVFIKSDTQGYDASVIRSGLHELRRLKRWTLRCEFAPYWMRSQGFDPAIELEWLCDNFFVCEAPLRTNWLASFQDVFSKPLNATRACEFTKYVESLNHDNKGWVDLYLFPTHPSVLSIE